VNPKWHLKIKQSSVKTAVVNLLGLQKNKNSTNKKVLIHQFVVKIAVQKHAQRITVAEADKVEVKENLSQSLVLNVVHKIPYHFNQEVIDQFFVEIVSKNNEVAETPNSGFTYLS
jgi:hypothetical protein